MIVTPFDLWWCCLRPTERTTLSALLAGFVINPTFILEDAYQLIVTTTGENSSIKMLEYFEQHYGLTHGEVPCGEDCVLEVVFYDAVFWAALLVFSTTDGFICDSQCKLQTFPL